MKQVLEALLSKQLGGVSAERNYGDVVNSLARLLKTFSYNFMTPYEVDS